MKWLTVAIAVTWAVPAAASNLVYEDTQNYADSESGDPGGSLIDNMPNTPGNYFYIVTSTKPLADFSIDGLIRVQYLEFSDTNPSEVTDFNQFFEDDIGPE